LSGEELLGAGEFEAHPVESNRAKVSDKMVIRFFFIGNSPFFVYCHYIIVGEKLNRECFANENTAENPNKKRLQAADVGLVME